MSKQRVSSFKLEEVSAILLFLIKQFQCNLIWKQVKIILELVEGAAESEKHENFPSVLRTNFYGAWAVAVESQIAYIG